MPLLEVETRAGTPIRVGETRIIPLAQSVRLIPPGQSGGLIWNRPVAVVAQTPGGEERVIPVRDVTRQAQLFLLAVGVLGSLLIWMAGRRVASGE